MTHFMRRLVRARFVSFFVVGAACSPTSRPAPSDAGAGLDSLNARLVQAYRTRDPQLYAALFTDSAVFEWQAFTTVRGRAGVAAMARSSWEAFHEQDLRLTVAHRRVASEHATEFGAFQQSWRDSAGVRMTEFGRYVVVFGRQGDRSWLIDRFFGFADSTRPTSSPP